MAKKYDTNPLDGDVLRRAEETRAQQTETEENLQARTQFFEAQTRQFSSAATTAPASEQPTQRFEETNLDEPYHSVFNKPQSPEIINNSVSSAAQQLILPPTSRPVLGLGLPENIAMILPYLPLTMGAIAAVIELLFVSRTETRVRFHAAQGLALHIASWIIGIMLNFVGEFLPFGNIGGNVFTAIVTVYFIISIFRVYQGKANHIEALDDITDFLNEKIKPKK